MTQETSWYPCLVCKLLHSAELDGVEPDEIEMDGNFLSPCSGQDRGSSLGDNPRSVEARCARGRLLKLRSPAALEYLGNGPDGFLLDFLGELVPLPSQSAQ